MFCPRKWVAHADLLNQSMFVMVCDWFMVEILPMVRNGPLHENYRGHMECVFPMHTVVTLESHIIPKAPNLFKTTLNDLECVFGQLGQLGPPLCM
jgi:hypothetical protein